MGSACSGRDRQDIGDILSNQASTTHDQKIISSSRLNEDMKDIIMEETSSIVPPVEVNQIRVKPQPELITLTKHMLTKKAAATLKDSALEFALIMQQMQIGFLKISKAIQKCKNRENLQVLCCEIFEKALQSSGQCCAIYGVRRDKLYISDSPTSEEKYVVMYSGLDNNVDPDINAGTLFAIWKRVTTKFRPVSQKEDILQSCNQMLASGYCMYGQGLQLVIALGPDVNGFSYDPSLREFILTQSKIKASQKAGYFSIDASKEAQWEPQIKIFLNRRASRKDKKQSFRHSGSLVADAHRTLLTGGILMLPYRISQASNEVQMNASTQNYEGDVSMIDAFILAFIFEKAWGRASAGEDGSLSQAKLTSLQQKTQFFCGSSAEVVEIENLFLSIARRQSINKSAASRFSSSLNNSLDMSVNKSSANQ